MKDFLKQLGINVTGTMDGDEYVCDLKNFDEFGEIYSKLDASDALDECDAESILNVDNGIVKYEGDSYNITLKSDFDGDVYTLTVSNA